MTPHLLKFFLLDVQHGLDPPHHLPKRLPLQGGCRNLSHLMKENNLTNIRHEAAPHACLILSKKGIPKVPKTSLWK